MLRVPGSAAKGVIALSALLAFQASALAGGLGDDFDVAFGAAVTSDYTAGGVSQTGGKPAVQGYVEANYNIFYVGTWASNVDFGVEPDAEIDLYGGIRPEVDRASFDLGYAYYVYANDTSPAYGSLYALGEYEATEALTVGGDVYYAPDYSQTGYYSLWFEGKAEYALPANFGISAALAYQYFEEALGAPNYWTWNAGVYWTFKDALKVDLRYVGSTLSKDQCALLMSRTACGNRVMATLSVDTAASAFFGRK